jgi:probable rRNA maturation factor
MTFSTSKSKVYFFFETSNFRLEKRTLLKAFIEGIFIREGKKLSSIVFIFCSDKRLLEINRQFLNHDYYTDIITFELSDTATTQAEVYISIDRIKENAKIHQVSFKSELHRVIFHGVLHLCGYHDKTNTQKDEMRGIEEVCLRSYFQEGP